jgi:ribokinase
MDRGNVMSPPIDVLVLGELNPDLLLTGADLVPRFEQVETLVDNATLTLGSSGAIFAAGTARLGLCTAIAGLVGRDPFGEFVIDRLRALGIDTDAVVVDPSMTTGLTVILSRGNDRSILTHLGAMAAMNADRLDPALLLRTRHVHVTSYFLQRGLQPDLPRLLRLAREHGASVSLDTNWDPAESWADGVNDVLTNVDTFLPNAAEAMALTSTDSVEHAAARLSRTIPNVVVKRGSRGAYAVCDGEVLDVPALQVDVQDTTGAGDSFDAGYVYAQLRGLPTWDRLRVASVCGALSTRRVGGTEAQATLDELRAALHDLPA